MASLISKSAFKKAILAKAEHEGKRTIDADGKYVKGVSRIHSGVYVEAERVLREFIERAIAQAHSTSPTLRAPLSREAIAAAGCGPRRKKR